VDNLSSTAGIVAIAAGAVAVVALGTSLGLALALRRVRSAQRAVLGDGQDAATRLDTRVTHAEDRLDGAVAYRSLIRYDAYGEMSGHQSTSIALLDATRSGIVLSSIHHRDQARLYAKQVHQGKPELELSPEEDEAIRVALEGGGAPRGS
jgi:hypothetical protein